MSIVKNDRKRLASKPMRARLYAWNDLDNPTKHAVRCMKFNPALANFTWIISVKLFGLLLSRLAYLSMHTAVLPDSLLSMRS